MKNKPTAKERAEYLVNDFLVSNVGQCHGLQGIACEIHAAEQIAAEVREREVRAEVEADLICYQQQLNDWCAVIEAAETERKLELDPDEPATGVLRIATAARRKAVDNLLATERKKNEG